MHARPHTHTQPHLGHAKCPMGMADNLLRWAQSRRHEECGPINGVEPEYVLPYDVGRGGPGVGTVWGPRHGEVVEERIQPHVDLD